MEDPILAEADKKTRNRWLRLTITCLFYFPFAVFVFSVAFFKMIPIPKAVLLQQLRGALIGLIPLWLIWHCCYRKYGTRLITFWLVVTPMNQIIEIVEVIQGEHDQFIYSILAIQLVLFVWWYILSLRMRRLNKAIRSAALVAT